MVLIEISVKNYRNSTPNIDVQEPHILNSVPVLVCCEYTMTFTLFPYRVINYTLSKRRESKNEPKENSHGN